LKLLPRVYNSVIKKCIADGLLVETGPVISLPGYEVKLTPQLQEKVNGLLARFAVSPFTPPAIKECQAEVGEELYDDMVNRGLLVPVSQEVVFRQEDYDHLVSEIQHVIKAKGALTVAEFRDQFNTSRRYALAFLEHLDAVGITIREGDIRHLHP
jgi:selenocysteine-specific elongation factor